jgi:transposase
MSRDASFSDAEWALIAPLMPSVAAGGGRPFAGHRRVVEGIIWHYRTGSPWRDLPASFGPWQTVWKRHARFAKDGTWDKIHAALLAQADAQGQVDWVVSVDSTINRTHQHAAALPGPGAGGQGVIRTRPPRAAACSRDRRGHLRTVRSDPQPQKPRIGWRQAAGYRGAAVLHAIARWLRRLVPRSSASRSSSGCSRRMVPPPELG